jgi:hypothetical protein
MISEAIHEIELDIYEKQNEIIKLQSDTISQLLELVRQYDQIESSGIMDGIHQAECLKEEIMLEP